MQQSIRLNNIQILTLHDGAVRYSGGDQDWFARKWQQRAGCGPTTCATLLWYLAKSRPAYEALCPYEGNDRAAFVRLMHDVWQYVTPGMMGVNTTQIFVDGARGYAKSKGIILPIQALELPKPGKQRIPWQSASDFIGQALAEDLPVALLVLSCGEEKKLDDWHWVTIVAFDSQTGQAEIYDSGERLDVDLKLWHQTTKMPGGLVAFR